MHRKSALRKCVSANTIALFAVVPKRKPRGAAMIHCKPDGTPVGVHERQPYVSEFSFKCTKRLMRRRVEVRTL